jgi:DNA-binding PadR family transcriptional regulator
MNNEMPWVNLTQEEVNDLRNKKFELTEYGKEKLRKLMNKPIEAKVSDEDFNKIVDAFNNPQPYPDAMFEEAEKREKLNAGFKQDADGNWYRPTLQELTRNERIELAEKEIAYLVMGGQDGREYANSIAFILQVLDSLRDD